MSYSRERELSELDLVKRNGYEPIAQFEGSRVPPDYLVRETSDGRLFSDSYEVEWPKRPGFGRYAEESKAMVNERNDYDEETDHLFVGAQTMTAVSKLLRQNDFRLYYQVPSSKENTIPIEIPLVLAYMSSAGEIYHLPIACEFDERTGRESWSVSYGDPRPSTFTTLSALVKYHKIYSYMDPKTGAIDTFPVWKGAVIDFDEMD